MHSKFRVLRLDPRFLIVVIAGLLGACGEGARPSTSFEFREDFDATIHLRPATGEAMLPALEPALSAEETRLLRDGFSWEAAYDLPETDSSGRPALYYALIYLQSRDDTELLEEIGVHHSFVPLFEEERAKWKGHAGFFTLEGDGEGVFTFAVIPGVFFNVMKELARQGEPVFRAVVLRGAPAQAQTAGGMLSYDYLASQGFLYGGGLPRETDATASEPAESGTIGRQTAALTSQVIRATVSPVEDTIDELRAFFGEIARGVDGSARIVVSVRPANTDPSFGGEPWMRRAWGDDERDNSIPTIGAPMWIRNAVVQSHKGGALFRGRLENWGEAGLTVAKGEQNICVELANDASEITNFLTALVLCNFRDPEMPDRNLNIQEDMRIVMDVQDPRTSMFAQFQDGHDYMRWVVGRAPRQARVVVGLPADIIGEFNGGRAVALCFGDPTTLPALPTAAIFETIGPGVLLSVGDADIVMPHLGNASANSRGVPTHEYGHFVMCDLMHATNAAKFYETWLNVMVNIMAPDRGAADPAPWNDTLYGTEAFADFFALQVVGGTNYFALPGSRRGGEMSYCPVAPPECPPDNPRTDATSENLCAPACAGGLPGCGQDCAEDNVGSPPGATSDYVSGTSDAELFDRNIARLVAIFHDAFDGVHGFPPEGRLNPTPGAAFNRNGGLFGAPVRAFTNANDEPIALPGSAMVDFFGNLFDQWATISEPNFLNALALTMFDHGYDANEVCEFFAIHSLTGDCTDLLHPSVLSGEDIVPGPVLNFRVSRGHELGDRDVTFTWSSSSGTATGYELDLIPASGAGRLVELAHEADVEYVESALEGDMLYTASAITVNGRNRSEPVDLEFVTFADPVDHIAVRPDRGRVEVSWAPPASGRLRSFELWQLEPEERLIEVTSDTSFTVSGLSDTFEYQFGVGTVNQVGEVGPLVPSARVRPLAPIVLYVAATGDDSAAGAGSMTAPFEHLSTAVERASETGADTIRLLEGTYAEAEMLAIDLPVGSFLRIEGGYRDTGSSWVPDGGTTRVEINGIGDGLLAPTTVSFNPDAKPAAAAVTVGGGGDLTFAHVTIAGVGAGGLLPGSDCTAVVHVAGSSLRLEHAGVAMERLAARNACVGAVFAVEGMSLEPKLRVSDSDIRGFSPPGIVAVPSGLQLSGAAIDDGDTLIVQDSQISGLTASLTFAPSDISSVGLAVGRTNHVRVQRTTLAATAPSDLHCFGTGTFNGAELEAGVGIVVDDSVFRTPSGGTRNNALEIRALPGGLPSVEIVHATAIAGTDWDLSEPVALPFEGAGLKIAGAINALHIVNSVFSFAAGGSNDAAFRWTGVDLSEREGLHEALVFLGNVVSTPDHGLYTNAAGSLIGCTPDGTREFRGAFDASGLQSEVAFTCGGDVPDTTRWHVGQNMALTEAPNPARGDLRQPLPWCAGANEAGYLLSALPLLPLPPLRLSGTTLAHAPVGTNAPADRGGDARNPDTREAAGAWLLVPTVDPSPILPPPVLPPRSYREP